MPEDAPSDEDERPGPVTSPHADAGPGARRFAAAIGEAVAVLLAYTATVALFMWPVAQDPFHRVTAGSYAGDRADQNLIMWILAWDWHALTTDPLSLFDANILHPALHSLAGAEHMLGVVPLSGPAYAISSNPLFALTITHILTLALCGTTMYALLRHWGVVRAGALFGGFVYALYPGQIQNSAVLQLLSRQYLPLVLIFLDETLRHARIRSAVAMAVFLLWQMLCSVYLAFISAISLVAYSGVLLAFHGRRLSLRGVGLVVAAVFVVALVLVPLHLPYMELRAAGVISDYTGTDMLTGFSSGPWRNWLIPPGLVRTREIGAGTGLFSYLGLFPVLAALCILVFRRRESAAWAAPASLAILLAGYVFALGPWGTLFGHRFTLPYGYFAEWVPGFSSMRAPTRFAIGSMAGLAALAGIGLGRALQALESRRHGRMLAAGVLMSMLAATAVEYDLPFDRPGADTMPVGDAIPPIYRTLAQMPEGPVLEIPWTGPSLWKMATLPSEYMYFSTYHWQRLLNGYTGHRPPSDRLTSTLVRALPDAHAIDLLARATGLRYVLVHLRKLPAPMRAQWLSNPAGLKLVARVNRDLLFEVAEPTEPDLMEAMRQGPAPGYTLLGTPIVPIGEEERRAEMTFTIGPPAHAPAKTRSPVEVEIHNPTDTPWPTLAAGASDLVEIDYRFSLEGGRPVDARLPFERLKGPLPYDLLPDQRLRVESWLHLPDQPGTYTLEVWLEQDGRRFEGSQRVHGIRVEAPKENAKTRK